MDREELAEKIMFLTNRNAGATIQDVVGVNHSCELGEM